MNIDQIAEGEAKRYCKRRGLSDLYITSLTQTIKHAIEKARGIKTTEYAKGWDDHVAAVRSARSPKRRQTDEMDSNS